MNKETLQEYNEKLEENNVSLANVLTTINNLPTASGGGGSSDIYSLEETIIGTWIDGKPLYRKVISYDGSKFTQTTIYFPHNIENIDVVVRQDCFWFDSGPSGWRSIPSTYYSNTSGWATQLQTGKVFINFELGTNAMERVRDKATQFYVVLEYTKTTD